MGNSSEDQANEEARPKWENESGSQEIEMGSGKHFRLRPWVMQGVESPVFWGSFRRQRLAWACLGLDPMAAQHDYCHGPNSFYSLDPVFTLIAPWDRVRSRPGMRASPSHTSIFQSLLITHSAPARKRPREILRHWPYLQGISNLDGRESLCSSERALEKD